VPAHSRTRGVIACQRLGNVFQVDVTFGRAARRRGFEKANNTHRYRKPKLTTSARCHVSDRAQSRRAFGCHWRVTGGPRRLPAARRSPAPAHACRRRFPGPCTAVQGPRYYGSL
jgi:hypothetical protein